MNGSAANSPSASAILTLPRRLAAFRTEGFPLIPISILLTVMLVAIFANALAPHNPEVGVLGDRFRPPAWQANGTLDHLLGTDHLGRDVLSRLIFGARISVIVGLMVIIVAGVIGTGFGIISGYLGRWVDQVIMRITDAWLALPVLTFALFLAAIVLAPLQRAQAIVAEATLSFLGTPTPRKESVASAMIAWPSCRVASTMAELITLGRMWRRMIVHFEQPATTEIG